MAISVAVAVAGAGLAYLMYYRRTIRPETFSEARRRRAVPRGR